jgi:fructose-1-phosphate kinase PfkB-like protein
LERALRRGADTLIQRAARTAEAALKAVEKSICLVATKEEWTAERRDQTLGEKRGPVQELLKRATDGLRAAAITEWIREVREIVPDAREQAEEIIEEKSTDYTRKEVDFFMQEFGAWSQQLDKLLVTGAAAGYAGQAAYEKESRELPGDTAPDEAGPGVA